jgi:hypothetical protein
MAVLLVPVSLAFFFGLLALADALERRSSVFLVRSSLRSPLSCEETEAVVAANLAPFLEAAGLGRAALEGDPVEETSEERARSAIAVLSAAAAAEADVVEVAGSRATI